ncbi:MAG: heavy metal-associated domain-containing protein [Nanoarchaeota archaeon]
MNKTKLTIEGMHCASCGGNVERALKKIKGVNGVSVSVLLKKASVESDMKISEDDLKKAVASAGYKLVKVE